MADGKTAGLRIADARTDKTIRKTIRGNLHPGLFMSAPSAARVPCPQSYGIRRIYQVSPKGAWTGEEVCFIHVL
jgi:hypothetical protein